MDSRLTTVIIRIDTIQVLDEFALSSAPRYCDKITVAAVDAMLSTIITRFIIWFALTMDATDCWETRLTIIWSIFPTKSCKSSSTNIGSDIKNRFLFVFILSISV